LADFFCARELWRPLVHAQPNPPVSIRAKATNPQPATVFGRSTGQFYAMLPVTAMIPNSHLLLEDFLEVRFIISIPGPAPGPGAPMPGNVQIALDFGFHRLTFLFTVGHHFQ